jgi:hypothetical protein
MDAVNGAVPWWRRKLVWGVSVSVLLGGFSLLVEGVDADLKTAAVITLLGIATTLVIEVRFQSEESAVELRADVRRLHRTQEVFESHIDRFTDYVGAPESCRAFLADISADWRRIDERSSVFLDWLRQDAEREFRARLHELSAGRGTVDRRSRHHFRTHPLIDFARIRSVDATLTNYWNTGSGRRYLDSQRSGIAAGNLEVTRVFVLSRDRLAAAREIVRRHVQAGVRVTIVVREDLHADPDLPEFEDMSLVTDHSGVTGVLVPGSAQEPELFTTEERQVAHAEEVVEFLAQYANGIDAVYTS